MSKTKLSPLQQRILELEKEVDDLQRNQNNGSTPLTEVPAQNDNKSISESEEKFRSLFNGINLPVFVHLLKSEGFNHFIEVNNIACEKYGYSRSEFLLLSPKDISNPIDAQQRGATEVREKLRKNGQVVFEATHVTKTGKKFPVEVSSNIYNWLGRKVILSIAIDISDRKIVEKALKESEEKYRHLIENSEDAIYLLYDRKFEIINKKFTQLFGITFEMANSPDFDFMNLVSPESRPLIQERIRLQAQGDSVNPKYEFKAINADKEIITVEATVSHIIYKKGVAAQGIIRDVTEKRQLEQQLQQAQKMEAIGTLAGGIAHDFNNLLTVINGYSELALQEIEKEKLPNLYSTIESIQNAGEKAEHLTRQLLAFSRKQIYSAESVNINKAISSMDKMLRRLIGEDIHIETILANHLPEILADVTQLEQIILNLIVNARDAVYAVHNRKFKKKITIETGIANLDEAYVEKHPGCKIGDHIYFSISDNGTGMDEKTVQKIFDPFFTTKDKLKGTGLGLSTVYGIVKQNNGSVYVYSELNQGTTFKIYWPVTQHLSTKTHAINKEKDILTGTESILFVEDDNDICRFASDALNSLGYNIKTASNGKQALDLFTSGANSFDLIITDLIMPELNGTEFVKKVKDILPEIKVIYVSGYTDNHIVHNGLLEKNVNFIQKPYSIKQLASNVRRVLDKL